jgi:phospholipase C
MLLGAGPAIVPAPPVVASKTATSLTGNSATLNATVNPKGSEVQECVFEYGSSESSAFGSSAACATLPGGGDSAVAVTATVSGLLPGTTYQDRISARNTVGAATAGAGSFRTLSLPAVSALSVGEVSGDEAKLAATVNPLGSSVEACAFEYGTIASGAYASSAPCSVLPGAGYSPVAVSAEAARLAPGTSYHFRVSASTRVGSTTSGTASFRTLSAPVVAPGPATSLTGTSATLNGTVDPEGSKVKACVFEYGTVTSAAFGASVPCSTLPGSGEIAVAVSAPVSGLAPGTIYHYRVTARNRLGASTSVGTPFQTQAPPTANPLTATALTSTSATLNAAVNPMGRETEACTFEYGTTASDAFGSSVACSELPGAGESTVGVSAPLTQLTPSTEYQFRLTVRNAVGSAVSGAGSLRTPEAEQGKLKGIHRIQHVVMIMQENRSFDDYFGTYPGANGIPAGVCVSDPVNGGCDRPFYNSRDKNVGGPHGAKEAVADIDGGSMDGFVAQAESALKCKAGELACTPCKEEGSELGCLDVMGYHDARQIPNYWTYAQNFVLQDDMFESAASWSEPEHRFLVSAWSATCPNDDPNPMDCVNSLEGGHDPKGDPETTYAWTDITWLLHKYGVSWAYYIFEGDEPDCEDDEAITCAPVLQGPRTPGIWNPLEDFTDVKEDNQLANIQSLNDFYTSIHDQSACGLPNVAWIDPNSTVSEHPDALISTGQTYVTTLVNAIMRSPCWKSTAIFISWDDWGGFYDSVVPPDIDENGYGLRVPGLVISPYAKDGYIDHQQLSHDAYLKFVEDDFLGGSRLNPETDERPDRRPDVREEAPGLGNLEEDFDFDQSPRPPLILPSDPAPGPASNPPGYTEPAAPPLAVASAAAPLPGRAPFQLSASVARVQDIRQQRGSLALTLGCNRSCLVAVAGSLKLEPPAAIDGARAALAAGRSVTLQLRLSASELRTVEDALHAGKHTLATLTVRATGLEGARRSYVADVELTDG